MLYTTADAEGMVGGASRAKRKRKPSVVVIEAKEAEPEPPSSAKKKPAKKTVTKKAPAKKPAKKNSAGAKVVSSKPAAKKAAGKRKAAGEAAKDNKRTKQAAPQSPEPAALDEDEAIAKDLYDKHRKDFERSFLRLEKLDQFGFFFEVPPVKPEPEEKEPPPAAVSSSDLFPPIAPRPEEVPSQPDLTTEPSPPKNTDPFANPPVTWYDLRERRDADRYIVDRHAKLEKERKRRLGPYIWDKRKKRKELETKGNKTIESWEINDFASKLPNKQGGKRSLTRNGVRVHPRVLHPKGVDWDLFRSDMLAMCNAGIARDPQGAEGKSGTLGHAAKKIKELMDQIYERTAKKQITELEFADARHEFTVLLKAQENEEAAFQGDWRTTPFPERKYERLKADVICAGLSPLDERSSSYEKQSELPDSFVGLAYTYNDTGESEGWMKSVFESTKTSRTDGLTAAEQNAANALKTDDGVVRSQVRATMRTLLIGVQDKVLTDTGTLKQHELRSANWDTPEAENNENPALLSASVADSTPSSAPAIEKRSNSAVPDLVEQSVWGMDCYTRRNVMICIEKDLDPETAVEFVEKWLLPAINACPVDIAHDLTNAAKILEGLPLQSSEEDISTQAPKAPKPNKQDPTENWSHSLIGKALLHKIKFNGPPWLKAAAHQLGRAIKALGYDFFRVHPKGHGSLVLSPKVKANTLVTFYRGEVYPSWRWGEKLDAIEMTQQHLGLRPNLPDFYNMALERPQADPKGYGLMIVDASRKAGHGSMLSHSCDPTCEVRVAALNGQLCLAMTTLRDIEQGEELTFDYNAVTESLEEYQAAVCLCGCTKCRGSFLHFATADCYQQVLNRNSPIAVRFANLVKGCTKKVMGEEDYQTLKTHAFGTAAFGAISFNRLLDLNSSSGEARLDSMSNVPVWLRTYVADVLRYIEYERRALPIALLCDHFKTDKASEAAKGTPKKSESNPKNSMPKSTKSKPKRRQQGEPREKPENSFQYFVRINKDEFLNSLGEETAKKLKGMEVQHAIRTVGSTVWKKFSDKEKAEWKERAIAEWKNDRGAEQQERGAPPPLASATGTNATLDTEVKEKKTEKSKKSRAKDAESPNPSRISSEGKDAEGISAMEQSIQQKSKDGESLNLSRISFEAADAEGISAMEQRIQQLTQALSRIGRVLDHHQMKNTLVGTEPELTIPATANHAPLSIMTDHEIVSWMWCNEHGVAQSLLRSIKKEQCASPSLYESLMAKKNEYQNLDDFVANPTDSGLSTVEARRTLTAALLALRDCLHDGVQELAKEFKQHELRKGRMKAQARRDEVKAAIKTEVMTVLQDIIDQVVSGCEDPAAEGCADPAYIAPKDEQTLNATALSMSPWLEHYHERWKLEAAADVLLLHARTSTFFKIVPYAPLESTPLEVYTRELGNKIPLSKIKSVKEAKAQEFSNIVLLGESTEVDSQDTDVAKEANAEAPQACSVSGKKKGPEACFDPDAVIANVTVKYSGEYVMSQLLQWFNGGVGQKPGLPDMVGCVLLPSIEATFSSSAGAGGKANKSTTLYRSQVRPRLFDWLRDPHQRGSTFPEELAKVFKGPELVYNGEELEVLPLGSPILDLLVMGEDTNINVVLAALDNDRLRDVRSGTIKDSAATRLESTIDEAMPAQAVAKWVQCENEDCLKWRRLPFFVDVDVLPEQFFCEDNVWNPAAKLCEAPEDTWDENDSSVQNDGVAKASDRGMLSRDGEESNGLSELVQKYEIGERYDVLRTKKKLYCTGEVVDTDFKGGTKRVKMHFPKVPEKFDEWIEVSSSRIAPLFSKQYENIETTKASTKVVTVPLPKVTKSVVRTVPLPKVTKNVVRTVPLPKATKNVARTAPSPKVTKNVARTVPSPKVTKNVVRTIPDPSAVAASLLALRHSTPREEVEDSKSVPSKQPKVAETSWEAHPATNKRHGGETIDDLEDTDSEDESSRPNFKKAKKKALIQHESTAKAPRPVESNSLEVKRRKTEIPKGEKKLNASSFAIPRKRKSVSDSPPTLNTSSLINTTTADNGIPRIPRKSVSAPAPPSSDLRIPRKSLTQSATGLHMSRDLTQPRPQIYSRDLPHGHHQMSMLRQDDRYGHHRHDGDSHHPSFGYPSRDKPYQNDRGEHHRRDSDATDSRQMKPASNGENQYPPLCKRFVPKDK